MVTQLPPLRSIAATAWIIACLTLGARAAQLTAELDRESVPAGQGATLSIRITGGRAARPQIPEVENLIVQSRGQAQQIQIINGTTRSSLTYTFAVGSNVPGDYQIPSFEVEVDGKKLSTAPLSLKVLPDASAQPPPAGLPGTPPPTGNPPPPADTAADENAFGFLSVELASSDRKHVYVGEIAPVRIRAWIPADARAQLRSGIQPEGKAFTLHHVSPQPQQTQEIKDGKRWLVVTWYGGISATKAGTYPASLSVQANVAVRDTSAPALRRPRGGPFDDPFFDSAFDQLNARYIEKDVTLTSRDQQLEVRPLPTEGRPANFTGAVGQFQIQSSTVPTQWRTGEPQQISATISGAGNFALLTAPTLTPQEKWKVYPPKDAFSPTDEASFSGTKQFQFSAIPRKGGPQEAVLELSYFDPDAGEYKTVRDQPHSLRVAGDDLAEPKEIPAATPPPKTQPRNPLVRQKDTDTPVRPLQPLVSRPLFTTLLGTSGGLFLCSLLAAAIRKRRADPLRKSREATAKATAAALRDATAHAAAGEVAPFFAAARRALQERLAARWNQPPAAITSAEVADRLPPASPVTIFFREADLHEYGRTRASGESFAVWRELLENALQSLTETPRP